MYNFSTKNSLDLEFFYPKYHTFSVYQYFWKEDKGYGKVQISPFSNFLSVFPYYFRLYCNQAFLQP